MPASTYLQNKWLNHLFGNGSFTAPSGWHLHLHTAAPGNDCLNGLWSAAGNKPIADWNNAALGAAISNASVEFTNLTNPGSPIGFFSIWDAASSGNPLLSGTLTNAVQPGTGQGLFITSGGISVGVSGILADHLALEMLDHTLGNGAYTTVPTDWYVRLHYGHPGTNGTLYEWPDAGPQQCADWTTSTLGATSNVNAIEWTTPLNNPSNAYELEYVTIWKTNSTATPTDLVAIVPAAPDGPVANGSTILIQAGDLRVSMDANASVDIHVTPTITASILRTAVAAGYSQVELDTSVTLR